MKEKYMKTFASNRSRTETCLRYRDTNCEKQHSQADPHRLSCTLYMYTTPNVSQETIENVPTVRTGAHKIVLVQIENKKHNYLERYKMERCEDGKKYYGIRASNRRRSKNTLKYGISCRISWISSKYEARSVIEIRYRKSKRMRTLPSTATPVHVLAEHTTSCTNEEYYEEQNKMLIS